MDTSFTCESTSQFVTIHNVHGTSGNGRLRSRYACRYVSEFDEVQHLYCIFCRGLTRLVLGNWVR